VPIAPGGQAVGMIAGSTDWRADDNGRFTFTNNDEGSFVRAFDRLFDMYGKGLSLPQNYTNTETIADTLIA
jgi:ABC-type glycerol-3-phosphate transport system substrate-binding protein